MPCWASSEREAARGNFLPPPLASGSVCDADEKALRNRLVAEVLDRFWGLYRHSTWTVRSTTSIAAAALLGEPIVITRDESRVRARAVDLTEDFKLVVELPDKTRLELPYGEVSTAHA